MSRKKIRELKERNNFLACECNDQHEKIVNLRLKLYEVSRGKKEAEDAIAAVEADLEKYQGLYADEMQKRLELAEMARKLEEENRELRAELKEVLGE